MKSVRRFAIAVALCVVACVAIGQQAAEKPPMPLATAWQNVQAACSMAMDDLLVGRQSKALRESLVTIQKALVIYEQYTTVK